MPMQTSSLRIFTCFLAKKTFSVRTSLTEQVHYREIVTILPWVGKKTEIKKVLSCVKIDMRHQTMSHHNTATFLYKFIEAKKRINEINSSMIFKKSHFFHSSFQRKWVFGRLSIVLSRNVVVLLPYLSK